MSRKRWFWTIALALVAIVIAASAFAARQLPAYALIATGYVAQQTCACLNVAQRERESCMADFPEDDMTHIKVEVGEGRVSASAFGLFRSEAVYEEGYGCSPTR